MKHQTTNPKSAITSIKSSFLLAACLILAALGPPAAELSRAGLVSPPSGFTQTVTFPGICGFDVQATVTGKQGVISLPSGGSIVTGPVTFGTFTNLSDPTKNVTLNMPGVFHVSSDQNGNTIVKEPAAVWRRIHHSDFSYSSESLPSCLIRRAILFQDPRHRRSINICQLIN